MAPSKPHRSDRFDLAQLCAAAADLLGTGGPEDQRVRALPDARTVRYYQSIGLVDRPAREGREAVYGWRHLLQVVAVKRLQMQGEPLSRIQTALVGLPTEALEAALDIEDAFDSDAASALRADSASDPSHPSASGFVTREIAPGVLVVVDPTRVEDAETVLQALSQSIVTVISRTPHGGAS